MSRSRVEAFSDGVFAIAMTLLILDVHEPPAHAALEHALLHQWPSYASYAVSFLIIGIIWVNHHALFGLIVRVDRGLLYLNLLLLMVVAFIPFPTAILAQHVRSGGSDAQVAAVLYSATMTLMGCAFTGLWAWIAYRREQLCEDLHPRHARAMMLRSLRGPVVYGLSIGVALLSPPLTLVVYALVALYFALPGKPPASVAS